MRRRDFITFLSGAAATWPLAARAQQPKVPVIGYLDPGTQEAAASFVAAFRRGLSQAGYVEGRDVTIEFRWGENDEDRLPELAADLVRRRVSLIAASESTAATRAAKSATTTIPIIFVAGLDPVQSGLVASLNRPGGNATGIIHMNAALGPKRLELLHELLPNAALIAWLSPGTDNPSMLTDLRTAATATNLSVELFIARSSREIDAAFANIVERGAKAVLVNPGPLFTNRRAQIVTLATRHALPVVYPWREDATAGGLMSYGPSITDQFRQAGLYAARLLKGEKPADLPVMRATKFEFVINLQTARTLGIAVPPTLLALADEVIE
jgi:putative ABC transport system substrate-binding protein